MIKLIVGVLWFLVTIGALFNIWQESRMETLPKLAWTAAILFFPILGPVAYMLYSKK
ncbi:MAG: PLDc N-terminal domain-containing protein [Bacteroidia bacterium]|nr:PLDc N-terminal domain-containing protein [Bacteroidia bacterium]